MNNAFLNSYLFEEVYMDLSLGYKRQGEHHDHNQKYACKLHRSICDLKQASRQWYTKFSSFDSIWFHLVENWLFFIYQRIWLFLCCPTCVHQWYYVTGPSVQVISSLKAFLNIQFKVKDIGNLKYSLGIEIAQADEVALSQRHYTLQLLERYWFSCITHIPMDTKVHLNAHDGDILPGASQYRRLIGHFFISNLI